MGSIVVYETSFKSAVSNVRRELKSFGCWTDELRKLKIRHGYFAGAYGYQFYGSSGEIVIPAVSLCRVIEKLFDGPFVGLRDVIRHEYAHGIAYCHPELVLCPTFVSTFGGDHDLGSATEYCHTRHVTEYAATHPCEDFAEVFMYYCKHKTKVPKRFCGLSVIEKKFAFLEQLCKKLSTLNHK